MDSGKVQGDLLARHRAGDPAAFDLLVAEMAPRLKGFFQRQGSEAATAEDLTQNVFVRVLKSLDRYQPSGQMDAYFLRIARNLWIDHQRRAARFHRVEDGGEEADQRPGPEFEVQQRDRAARVRSALADLDPGVRELLEFAVLQRLPYKEVAELLQIPIGTVKSRVFYALRKLRDQLSVLEDEA
jgi:RNA polymerase sigma-70 factor (ECF subfamily)